jgi:hypothetical protein
MLPQLARGDANKIWVIPSEFTQALSNLGGMLPDRGQASPPPAAPSPPASPPPASPPPIGPGDGPA